MALELSKVHHYVKEPGGRSVRLARTNPLMRFSTSTDGPIFLQGGLFYYEGGEPVGDEHPPWLAVEISKAGVKALRECGYVGAPSSERQNSTLTETRPGRVAFKRREK